MSQKTLHSEMGEVKIFWNTPSCPMDKMNCYQPKPAQKSFAFLHEGTMVLRQNNVWSPVCVHPALDQGWVQLQVSSFLQTFLNKNYNVYRNVFPLIETVIAL